jgi:hypothetical protein
MPESSATDLRSEPRIDVDLDVTLRLPEGQRHFIVDNVSRRGVFLITPDPLPLRRLVHLRTELDDDGGPLTLLGRVAHRVTGNRAEEQGRRPGMGLQLYPADPDALSRWQQWVDTQDDTS